MAQNKVELPQKENNNLKSISEGGFLPMRCSKAYLSALGLLLVFEFKNDW